MSSMAFQNTRVRPLSDGDAATGSPTVTLPPGRHRPDFAAIRTVQHVMDTRVGSRFETSMDERGIPTEQPEDREQQNDSDDHDRFDEDPLTGGDVLHNPPSWTFRPSRRQRRLGERERRCPPRGGMSRHTSALDGRNWRHEHCIARPSLAGPPCYATARRSGGERPHPPPRHRPPVPVTNLIARHPRWG